MKKYLLLIASAVFLAACSSPKYAYYFDHYDYNSGKKKAETSDVRLAQADLTTPEMSPLQIDQHAVAASAESRIKNVENVPVMMQEHFRREQRALLEEKYSSLTKAEKKEFRRELKSEVKEIIKAKKNGEDIKSIMENKAMDSDLKMALIFGIVAIVLSAFGAANSIFWILGTVSAVIALVFLIIWIAKQ
jgi:PBP1b-binding outer membrane lipoprotein LpoB